MNDNKSNMRTEPYKKPSKKLLAMLGNEPPEGMHGYSTIIVKGIPRDVHAIFKAFCARRSRTMRGVLIALMKEAGGGRGSHGLISMSSIIQRHRNPQ